MSSSSPSPKTYLLVFAALVGLLILTVALAEVDLDALGLGPWNFITAMLISVAKTSLIVLFFMHIKYASFVTRLFAVASLAWLMLMVLITVTDYMTRAPSEHSSAGTAVNSARP